MNISELRDRIKRAKPNKRDALEVALLVAKSTAGIGTTPIRQAINAAYLQIAQLVGDGVTTTGPYTRALANMRKALSGLVPEFVDVMAHEAVRLNREQLRVDLPVHALEREFGPFVDSYGNISPRSRLATKVPNAKDGAPLEDILITASPLLYLNGDRSLLDNDEAIDLLRGQDLEARAVELAKPVGWKNLDEDGGTKRRQPWDQRLDGYLTLAAAGMAAAVATAVRNEQPKKALARAREQLGVGLDRNGGVLETPEVAGGGLLRRMQLLGRDEGLRVRESDKDIDRNAKTLKDVLVGYSLHSVFERHSDPSHTARDGFKFYRDNRADADLTWANRIIPPYRVNCLCFTRNIYADPQRQFREWEAVPKWRGANTIQARDVGGTVWEDGSFVTITQDDVGRRVGRPNTPRLRIRDVGQWEKWFDQQRPGIKQTLVGQRRFFAAASRGGGVVRYRDLVRLDGRIMSPREIVNESGRRYRVRRDTLGQLFDRIGTQRREALRKRTGIFDLSGVEETKYRRRLRRFLGSVL